MIINRNERVSEELSSVETFLYLYSHLDNFQLVSEELSSVETRKSVSKAILFHQFQKNLVVWKHVSF